MFELLADAKQRGARLLCGGETPAGYEQGNWITPALLADVTEDMRVSREEIFGPIIALRPYRDLREVLRLAVATEYGQAPYLFGHDARKPSQAFEALEFGEVFVHDAGGGPQLPQVGVKQSGIGGEDVYKRQRRSQPNGCLPSNIHRAAVPNSRQSAGGTREACAHDDKIQTTVPSTPEG